MALYRWRCNSCGQVTQKLLASRPVLDICCFRNRTKIDPPLSGPTVGPCGGKLAFVSNTHSQTKEVIDNGLMARALERPANTEELHAERNANAVEKDDELV